MFTEFIKNYMKINKLFKMLIIAINNNLKDP